METVCVCVCADAAPAEREPIATDPGGNNRRALSLSSSAPTWDFGFNAEDRSVHSPWFRFLALPGMRKWMRTLVEPTPIQGSTGRPEWSISARLPHGARYMWLFVESLVCGCTSFPWMLVTPEQLY